MEILKRKDHVIFTGVRKDIPSILSAVDLFVLPSLYEGLPVIGIEAQASGLSCIFSDSITKDVNLTNVDFVSLDSGIENWCDVISKQSFKHNDKNVELIAKSGYDIDIESEKLVEKYYEYLK